MRSVWPQIMEIHICAGTGTRRWQTSDDSLQYYEGGRDLEIMGRHGALNRGEPCEKGWLWVERGVFCWVAVGREGGGGRTGATQGRRETGK